MLLDEKITIRINSDLKKQCKIKAIEENKTLSSIVNSVIEIYVNYNSFNDDKQKLSKFICEQFDLTVQTTEDYIKIYNPQN